MKNNNLDLQSMVKEFHILSEHPVSELPTLPTLQRWLQRKGWGVIEEVVEQIHTLCNNKEEFIQSIDAMHKALETAKEKMWNREFITDETDKKVALADGLGDEAYFLFGDAVEAGIPLADIVAIIQKANMSKFYVDENGRLYAKKDAENKVKKAPTFQPPEAEIKEYIEKLIEKGNE